MSYSIEALKAKINSLSGNSKGDSKTKLTFWKPSLGTHDIRFLPLVDGAKNPLSQPFYEVAYYDNKDLGDRRFVAPSQYGEPDCLKEVALQLAKDKSREAWLVRKKLTPRERYYSAILVRGEEEKGVQVWEISPKVCKEIYSLLVMPDYADEDLFSVESGFDFTVSVTATDKMFNNYPVKEIKLVPRRKSSKLAPKKEQIEALQQQVPNFEAYFKAQVKSADDMIAIRDNFLAAQTDDAGHTETGAEGTSRGTDTSVTDAIDSVNDAFKDLNDDN
jgi:hypothetical protein